MIDFRTLRVWESFHEIVLRVYVLTKNFPTSEAYGLTSQIRRASVSIAANIAEGCGRSSDAELNRFLIIAMGSASELEYELLLAKDLSYISQADYEQIQEDIIIAKKMLNNFIKKIKSRTG
ncbi:MAG: four helix bundle protein [Bacteroidota bacterium]